MLTEELTNDLYENGYGYDLTIRLADGRKLVARYDDSTSLGDGISKTLKANGAEIVGTAEITVYRKPKTENFHPLVFRPFSAVKVDGRKTGEEFPRFDKKAKIGYLRKYFGHKVEFPEVRRLVRSEETW